MKRDGEIIKTSFVGIAGNILLVAGKIVVGLLASSISIITDAVNNLTDAMSSIVTIVGTKLSGKKPDKKHPYGHGRTEFITSALIAMIIFVAGALAIYESVVSLIDGEQPAYDVYSFVIVSLAIVVKIALGLYFRLRGNKLSSDALRASGTDALMDSILSFGTLVGALISYLTGVHLEGYIGIVIGLLIIKSSIDVFRESASKIIGERTDAAFAKNMVDDIAKVPGVLGVYDLIINNYGADRNIASVHVEVADDMTAKEIQAMERSIGYICYEKFGTIMTVGVYAKNDETEGQKMIKEKILSIVKDYPEILQTHGFYADEERRVISLDIVISFDCKTPDKTYKEVCEKVSAAYPDYTIQIVIDNDFSLSE
ncbi:MAG: cation transporter [Clostridia bacterium]|nr:cation transporter [Clostridia bacterium]